MQNAVGAVQSALILGGGSEIAAATAVQLAQRGCTRFVLAARHPDELDAVEARILAAGAATVERLAFDALDTSSHEEVIDKAFAGGDVDLVLLAFGVLGSQSDFDADPAAAVQAVQANYVGGVSASLHVARCMRRQGHGVLVVLSSVAGERVRAANFVYGSSKAGLDGFALGLGDAVFDSGIRVMVVRPGFVHTRMTEGMDPAPLSTTPDQVAADIMRGLEKGAEIVWSPAPLRYVLSVLRHVPRPIFRKLPV